MRPELFRRAYRNGGPLARGIAKRLDGMDHGSRIEPGDPSLMERLQAAACLVDVRGEDYLHRVVAASLGEIVTAQPSRVSSGDPESRALIAVYPSKLRDDYDGFHRTMRACYRAGRAIQQAIREGRITRPTTCEACGESSDRIEAAHHDYSRPLDVLWLCVRCHREWDRSDPKLFRSAA